MEAKFNQERVNKEFNERIDEILAHVEQLSDVALAVGSLPEGGKHELPNGTTVGKKEFKQLRSCCKKEIKELKKMFAQARKQHKPKRAGASNGFRNSAVVEKTLCDFFKEAELGPSYKRNGTKFSESNKKLSADMPMFLENGVTSSALLTPLFSIYAHKSGMQLEKNRQYLKATPLMHKYFDPIFKILVEEDDEKIVRMKAELEEMRNKKVTKEEKEAFEKELQEFEDKIKKTEKDKFNPDEFRYSRFQSIVSKCRKDKKDASPPQVKLLEDSVKLKSVLESEQRVVSETLAYYRELQNKKKEENQKKNKGK